jgi:hypothetical protein
VNIQSVVIQKNADPQQVMAMPAPEIQEQVQGAA